MYQFLIILLVLLIIWRAFCASVRQALKAHKDDVALTSEVNGQHRWQATAPVSASVVGELTAILISPANAGYVYWRIKRPVNLTHLTL